VIAVKDPDDEACKSEAANLLFHLLALCDEKNVEFAEVVGTLKGRVR
jgi:phosphoribosyl-ATP pyrophosphohydrolase